MKLCPICQRRFIDTQDACALDGTELVATDGASPTPQLGRVLGSYRLISLLGEGGMGNIFIGAHTRLDRFVAIKMLRPELSHRPETIARFFDEARTINRLAHPNIVTSIDLVEDVVDGAYCVLELLRGRDLRTRLTAGALPSDSVLRIGAQIADALAAVHALEIVHRDLKPENLILIERDGRDDFVKLIDFGVAQISDEAATGKPFGTAAYMAPEQAAGTRVDGRADVYALGVLLFEMATGRHPFPSKSDHEYVMRHAADEVPRPSRLVARMPRELEAIIVRCLAKRPEERFASAGELAAALRAVDVTALAARPHRKTRAIAGAVVLAGAAAAIAIATPGKSEVRSPKSEVPAPAAAPAAPSARPAQPPTVPVAFASVPPGAQVFREGETVPLGTTPFRVDLPASERALRVRFQLAGYHPAEQEVALTGPVSLEVPLHKVAHSASRRRNQPQPDSSYLRRGGVLDPFK